MKQLRILEAHELGHGILIEMDAGFISPQNEINAKQSAQNKLKALGLTDEEIAALSK